MSPGGGGDLGRGVVTAAAQGPRGWDVGAAWGAEGGAETGPAVIMNAALVAPVGPAAAAVALRV